MWPHTPGGGAPGYLPITPWGAPSAPSGGSPAPAPGVTPPGAASAGGALTPPQGGFMGNPLMMAGIMGLASHFGGGNSGAGMAAGMTAAAQHRNNLWSQQLQSLQLQKLARAQEKEREQEDALARLSGNPAFREKLGGLEGVWGNLPPSMQAQVASGIFETMTSPPDLPGPYREYQLAQAQGYGGTFEDWKSTVARSPGTTLNVNTGAPYTPRPVVTGEAAAALNLNPDKSWQADKQGIWRQVSEPDALSGETGRALSLARAGLADMSAAEAKFFPVGEDGKPQFDRAAWAKSFIPATDEYDARVALERALANQLRIKSGAVLTADEIRDESERYLPSIKDGPQGALDKLASMRAFLSGTAENVQPRGPGNQQGGDPARFATMDMAGLQEAADSDMTEEEDAAWRARFQALQAGGG